MVDGELFDKLEQIARQLRYPNLPFGGIQVITFVHSTYYGGSSYPQVIATGDFFQLPPVNPNGDCKFAFEATSWNQVITKSVLLKQVFRQKDQSKRNFQENRSMCST